LGEQPVEITKDEQGTVLKLRGTLDISVAEELHRALRDFLSGPPNLILDLSAVDGCDTAVLQLLCSARYTAERSAKHLEFAGRSAAVLETSLALGLSIAGGAREVGPNAI
jgi:anti-anti-sigma factor